METLIQDVRYGLRMFRHSPGFVAVAVLTLSLAIGANTAIFSVLKAVLLEPFSYRDADRIVLLWAVQEQTQNYRGQVSATEVEDIKHQSTSLENIAAYADWTPTLSGIGDAERLAATQVGDGFFDVLGAKSMLGRLFTPDEQIEGKDNVVVLSYQLWQNRFASDPNIIGRSITLSGLPHVVVGVLPKDFRSLPSSLVDGGQLYRPVAEKYDLNERFSRHLRAIGKLKPGVSVATAQAEIASIAQQFSQQYPKGGKVEYRAVSLYEDLVSKLRATLYVIAGAVLLLLLIACANVANLLLARSSVRTREMAVRAALGAGQARLIAQSLTESLLLAAFGGAAGLLIAHWSTKALAVYGSKVSSQLELASVDTSVLVFCLIVTLLTGLVFGLAPAAQVMRVPVSEALKSSSRGSSYSRSSLRSGLIIAEVAMAVVMLVSAGLLVKSFHRLLNVDPGFDPKGRLAVNVWLPYAKYKDPQREIAFFREMLSRVGSAPGIASAGLVSNPPMGNFDGRIFTVEGQNITTSSMPEAQFYISTPRYGETMGIPLLAGRWFVDSDNETAPPVAIISKKLAESRFPGQDPIGKKIQVQSGKKENGQYLWRTVVGVVSDVKQHGLDIPAVEEIYVPFPQMPVTWMTLVAHTSGDPRQAIGPIRNIIKQLDPEIAPFRVSTYEGILGDTIATRKFALLLVSGFGSLALVLGIVGLYGVISYSVAQRTQEIGIRMALGAQRSNILRAVLNEGLRLTVVGLLIGCAFALAATRALQSLLYEIKPTDPTTFVAIIFLLTASATVACLIPARRATQVDPMVALRYE